jgi:hypothetical protein
MTKTPTMFPSKRLRLTVASCAVAAGSHDVVLEQRAARVPDDEIARALDRRATDDRVVGLPELDPVAAQLGVVPVAEHVGAVDDAAPARLERDAEERLLDADVRDRDPLARRLDPGVLRRVAATGAADDEVVEGDVVRVDGHDGPDAPSVEHDLLGGPSVATERPAGDAAQRDGSLDDEVPSVHAGREGDLGRAERIGHAIRQRLERRDARRPFTERGHARPRGRGGAPVIDRARHVAHEERRDRDGDGEPPRSRARHDASELFSGSTMSLGQ